MRHVIQPSIRGTLKGRQEAPRFNTVRGVFLLFALSLAEGALRKWILPDFSGPLTLLRDPFVVVLYVYCLGSGLVRRSGLAVLWLLFAAVTALFGLFQFIWNGYSFTGWLLGVRTYWLYMPLAFIVAGTFSRDDILRFLRLMLWVAIPYAVLVAIQYRAGPTAYVNLGVGGDVATGVSLSNGIVRPFGLFTFTGPNVQYTAATFSAFLAIYFCNVEDRPNRYAFIAMAVAVAVMCVLTGSRIIYFQIGIILLFSIAGLMLNISRAKIAARTLGVAAFIGLAAGLYVFAFSDMMDAMALRFEIAENIEGSLWDRIYSDTFAPFGVYWTASFFGVGIGLGAPGVSAYLGLPDLAFGESDIERNLNELGIVLGLCMITLRAFTSYWMCSEAMRGAFRGRLWSLPLAGFVAPAILSGQITHSPLNGFIIWLMAGMIISVRRIGMT